MIGTYAHHHQVLWYVWSPRQAAGYAGTATEIAPRRTALLYCDRYCRHMAVTLYSTRRPLYLMLPRLRTVSRFSGRVISASTTQGSSGHSGQGGTGGGLVRGVPSHCWSCLHHCSSAFLAFSWDIGKSGNLAN